jgi:luciferase family oxidoreductase group 1
MRVRAVPGEGLNIPIWLLGSSGFSAQLAGHLGLPFSFASHFSPEYTLPALELYRETFQPSDVLDEPYAMVGVNVIAAVTDEEAHWLSTSMQQQILSLIRGTPGQLKPPVDDMDAHWTEYEKAHLQSRLETTIVGSAETVKRRLQEFLDKTQADEMIVNAQIYDHKARLRSYEIVSQVVKG